MKRLILGFTITFMLISGTGANAQNSFSSKNTLTQSTANAWFTLTDVVQSQFSPDGHYLAVRTSTHFRVYDMYQNTPTLVIETEAEGNPYEGTLIAFSLNSEWVAINIEHERPIYTVRVWELSTRAVVAELTQDFYAVDQLAFSPSEPLLIISHRYDVTYHQGIVTVWEFETDTIRDTVRPGGGGRLISISPDGEWLLINVVNGTSSITQVYNLQTGSIIEDLFLRCDCAISPTWEYAILHHPPTVDNPILVSLPTLEHQPLSDEFNQRYGEFDWNHDGHLLAAVEDTGRIRIYDLENGGWIRVGVSIDEGRLPSIHFHPTENIVATIYHDNSIELWDADTGRLLQTLTVSADYLEFHQFSPDGGMISTVDNDNRIYIWSLESGDQLYEFETSEGLPIWSQFSADGRLFLARQYYDDNNLWVWRLALNSAQNSE